jgi:hypothetical protein
MGGVGWASLPHPAWLTAVGNNAAAAKLTTLGVLLLAGGAALLALKIIQRINRLFDAIRDASSDNSRKLQAIGIDQRVPRR